MRLRLDAMRESVDVVILDTGDTVEAAALREGDARDMAEAVSRVAGVAIKRRGVVGADVVVRGLQGADVNVLVDGQRLCPACPGRMDPPAFHVDFAEIERVEVTRGPFDIKNVGGLGGTVNVKTQRPAPGLAVRPSFSLGTAGYVNPVLVAAWGGKPFSALGGISYREAGPFRDGGGRRITEVANYRSSATPDTAFRLTSAWGQALYFNEGRAVQLHYTRQQADDVLYPGLLMDANVDDTDRAQVTYETAYTKVQFGLSRVVHWMTDGFRASAASAPRGYSMGTHAEAMIVSGRAEWRHGGLTIGGEAGRRTWETSTEMAGRDYVPQPSLPNASSDNVGAFALYDHDFTVAWGVSAGLRLDGSWTRVDTPPENLALYEAYHDQRDVRRADALPAARLRVTWRPRPGSLVSAVVGHAARIPEPNERYFALRRPGTDWIGNPALRPSRTTGADLSGTFEFDWLRLELGLFANAVQDQITVAERARLREVAGVANERARTWENVDATLVGGEAQVSFVLPKRVFLDVGLSYVRGSQEPAPARGLTSHNLPEMPPLRGAIGLRYDDGERWLRLEARGAARQTRINTDLLEEETAGYVSIDATCGTRWRRLSLTLGAINLLDRLYYEHLSFQRDPFGVGVRLPEAGRHVFLNASMRF
jgi:iron complex outermembrane receptor protein